MSLLDTASLLLTPNAYKEGKLYSVIPSDGSGDFTFTRATTATRVNSDGLVELVPYNLLTYSEQFNNAAWVKVQSTVDINTQIAPNGTLTATTFTDNSAVSAHSFVRFNSWLTTPQTASIYVKPNTLTKFFIANTSTGNAVCFDLTTATIEGYTNGSGNAMTNASIENAGNGWFRVSATQIGTAANQTLTFGFYKVFNATSFGAMSIYVGTGESAYIWGAQLVEGTNALPYQKTETRLNIPRIDNSLGGCPNILLEPQRTNLAIRSQEFDSASWTKTNTTVTANTAISPSGLQDADKILSSSTTGFVNQSIATVIGTGYTYSIYIKNIDAVSTAFLGRTSLNNYNFAINWSGNTITSITNIIGNASYTLVGDGWYRITCTFNSLEAAIGNRVYPDNTIINKSVFLWGAQLEAGSYATSYIPTTTASVTRNADLCAKTGVSSLIGQDEGTVYTELYWEGPREASSDIIALMSNTTNYFRFFIRPSNGSFPNAIEIVRSKTGETLASARGSSLASAQILKIALVYSLAANTLKMYVNGSVYIDTTLSYLPSMSWIKIGSSHIDTNQFGNGIKSTALWQFAATDDECIQLTTL